MGRQIRARYEKSKRKRGWERDGETVSGSDRERDENRRTRERERERERERNRDREKRRLYGLTQDRKPIPTRRTTWHCVSC